jgi:hypothetical protein
MYRDLWRVHALAALSVVACAGLSFDAFRAAHPWTGIAWLLGAFTAAGVLTAPIIIKCVAKTRNPPPGVIALERPTGDQPRRLGHSRPPVANRTANQRLHDPGTVIDGPVVI